MHHANAMPEGRSAPVAVDKEFLQHLPDVSRNPDVLTFNDLTTIRASQDATLCRLLRRVQVVLARGAVAFTVRTLGDEEGNMPKRYIREWTNEERLPHGWSKPKVAIGLRNTTRISDWGGTIGREKVDTYYRRF
jgi:hypothetical protein